jgi:hypothetical protein
MSNQQWPKLKRDYAGLRVRLLREIQNGYIIMPAGAVLEVGGWYGGLELTGPRCACCGMRPFMRKVPIADVELLPSEEHPHE